MLACLWLEGVLGKLPHYVLPLSLHSRFHCKFSVVCAGLHTIKWLVSQPFPFVEARRSPRSSRSKTIPTAARTFCDIHPWPDFVSEARQLENNLDDSTPAYKEICLTHESDFGISSAADECEVRGTLVAVMHGINNAAQILGIRTQCVGGGSGRSLSSTDLVVRKCGQTSNPEHLSALILAAGEVKGTWQLNLQRGERLEDMLRDPKRIDMCVLALQQASQSAFDYMFSFNVGHLHCKSVASAHTSNPAIVAWRQSLRTTVAPKRLAPECMTH